jgi:hypothetical protein
MYSRKPKHLQNTTYLIWDYVFMDSLKGRLWESFHCHLPLWVKNKYVFISEMEFGQGSDTPNLQSSFDEMVGSVPLPLLNMETIPYNDENMIIGSLSKDVIITFSIEDDEKTRDIKESILRHKIPCSVSKVLL